MARLTAEMVIDMRDRTGRATQSAVANLTRLQRAERELEMARAGTRMSRQARAVEAVAAARYQEEQEIAERTRANYAAWASRGTVAVVALGAAAAASYKSFAETERRVNRILVTAGKGSDAIRPTIANLQALANSTKQDFGSVVGGLEALIASGRSLDEALAFLPSVALTAQASGSAISDIALSADAMASSLGVASNEMQRAFDILVTGGKLGKFELNDMSQHLASLAPAFAALGNRGTDGVKKLVVALQLMRNQTGSGAEAATLMSNVLNKIDSADIAKKFKAMGINLPRALKRARAEGLDVLDVFQRLAFEAVKGDLSKLPRLFTDAEMLKGMRALMTQGGAAADMMRELQNVDGASLRDFNQIAADSAAKIQEMTNNWQKFMTAFGGKVATVVNPALEAINKTMDEEAAYSVAIGKRSAKEHFEDMADYTKLYMESFGATADEAAEAFRQAYIKETREGIDPFIDLLDAIRKGKRGEREQERYAHGDPTIKESSGRKNYPAGKSRIPIPVPRPGPSVYKNYPGRGYAGDTSEMMKNWDMQRNAIENWSLQAFEERQKNLPRSLDPRLARVMGFGPTFGYDPGGTAGGTPTVSLSGPVVTQPSGVQKVEVTNMVRPNVTVNISVPVQQVMEDPRSAAERLGYEIRDQIDGAYSDN